MFTQDFYERYFAFWRSMWATLWIPLNQLAPHPLDQTDAASKEPRDKPQK